MTTSPRQMDDQRLLTLVGCIHGIVLELDGDARYLNVWADDPALLAVPREQVIGRTLNEVLGPSAGAPLTALVERVYRTGATEHLEYPLELDGKTRWFFCDIKRVPCAEDFTVVAIARDITERKAAEEALQAGEERYRLAAKATQDVIYDWCIPTNKVTFGNAAAAVIDIPEGGAGLEAWLAHLHPDDGPRIQASITAVLASDDPSWTGHYRLKARDGTYIEVCDRAFIVRHEGRPVRVVGSMSDVTQRNRLQAQLVQADRLAALGMLAAGVGHEINNPLSFVLGNLDLALEEPPLATTEEARVREAELRDALREARDGARRIAAIVKSLKLFGQSGPGEHGSVHVESVLEGSLKLAENDIRQRARLVRRFAAVPHVRVSETQLGQVCLNLIINAAQAIPYGHADAHEIVVSTALDEHDRVCISVSDTGGGIPPEHLDRIFDPFFATKAGTVGNGIGLSVSMSLVRAMGGELWVESPPGERTVFTVALPSELCPSDPPKSGRRSLRAA